MESTTAEPAPPRAAGDESAADATARNAGRGGLAIAVAKVSFILFGFAQSFMLPRLLTAASFGEVALVLSVVSVVNNVIVATAIQGVSRAVSQVPEADAERAFRRALRVHAVVAIVLSASFAALAGRISTFLSAPQLVGYFRLGALVIFLYGLYAPLVGSLNGRRRFLDQAGLDIGYGALRFFAMVGGAFIALRLHGSGVLGAIVGFIAAAAIIVPVALTRSGAGKPGGASPELRGYLGFLLPLAIGQAFLNLLMQTDLSLLSRYAGAAAAGAGAPEGAASSLLGVYRNAQLFAFLPYQMLMSVSFVLFPMLARARAEGDREAVKGYTMTGVRLGFLLTGLMCGVISAIAPHVLRLAFPGDIYWSQGGGALRILALGMGAFSLLGISSTALTSLGLARRAALLTALGVGLIATGCVVLIPGAPFGPAMLVQAATATSVALTITATIAGVVLARAAGGFVRLWTIGRVLFALAVALAAGSRLPWLGKPAVIGEALLVGAVYVVVLVVTGELGRADLGRLRAVAGRRG
jgi:stage V sporulation protein B